MSNDRQLATLGAYRAHSFSLYEKADVSEKRQDYLEMLDCDLASLYNFAHGHAEPRFGDLITIEWRYAEKPLPPGLLYRVAQGINFLRLTEGDVRERFLEAGAQVHAAFADVMGLHDPVCMWPRVWGELEPIISSGVTRRSRKNKGRG